MTFEPPELSSAAVVPLYERPEVYQRRWFLLGVLCLSLVMIVMAVSSLNVALPTIQSDLGASATMLQWILDSYALVFAGLLLVAGALGDRFGRKETLLFGLVLFGLGALVSGFAGSAAIVIVGRAIQGAGAAFVMPATLSLLTAVFPPAERPKAIATWVAFAGAGGALGPIVSGALLEEFWWGSTFLFNVPVVAVTAVAIAIYSPRSRDDTATPLDPRGAVLSLVGLTSLHLRHHRGRRAGLERHPRRGLVRARRDHAVRVRPLGASGRRAPDAADLVLRRSSLQRRQRGDHDIVLRDVRLVLPALAVPAVRPRVLAARGRPGDAAAPTDVHHPVAAQRRHRRPVGEWTHDRPRVPARRSRDGGPRSGHPDTPYVVLAVAMVLMGAGHGDHRRPGHDEHHRARSRSRKAGVGLGGQRHDPRARGRARHRHLRHDRQLALPVEARPRRARPVRLGDRRGRAARSARPSRQPGSCRATPAAGSFNGPATPSPKRSASPPRSRRSIVVAAAILVLRTFSTAKELEAEAASILAEDEPQPIELAAEGAAAN